MPLKGWENVSSDLGNTYDDSFFDDEDREGSESAPAIVKLLLELTNARSVLDVGCGTGSFLAAFEAQGVTDIFGVDGQHVDRQRLRIDPGSFSAQDIAQAFDLGRTFDLLVSTEVAEHIPPEQTDVYFDNLARHAGVVAFSAAIPDQGGVHHVNEQWPEYWIDRFEERGYECLDALRHRLWDDQAVAFYYRQNLILFARPAALVDLARLVEAASTGFSGKAMVHPEMWNKRNELDDIGLRRIGPAFARGITRSVTYHARRRGKN